MLVKLVLVEIVCSKKGYCKFSFAAQNYYKKLKNTLANPKKSPLFTKLQRFFAEITRFSTVCDYFSTSMHPSPRINRMHTYCTCMQNACRICKKKSYPEKNRQVYTHYCTVCNAHIARCFVASLLRALLLACSDIAAVCCDSRIVRWQDGIAPYTISVLLAASPLSLLSL